jgi:hypothetical protein
MKKRTLAAGVFALALVATPGLAHAGVHVFFGFPFPLPFFTFAAPAPAVVAPAPVYVPPPPVYYPPAVAYGPPAYYGGPPVVVYGRFGGGWHRGWYGHRHGRW